MYLSLNGEIIPNHGYVAISDIGSNDPTALLCNTDRGQGGSGNSGGDWFAPDGTTVGNSVNNKWKNHFYEMKGDVGMSLHEKERNKKMPTPRHKVTHNPIPTSLFCFNMLFVCLL